MKLWFTSSDKGLVKAEMMRTGSTLCSARRSSKLGHTGAHVELPWLTAHEVEFRPILGIVFSIETATFRL